MKTSLAPPNKPFIFDNAFSMVVDNTFNYALAPFHSSNAINEVFSTFKATIFKDLAQDDGRTRDQNIASVSGYYFNSSVIKYRSHLPSLFDACDAHSQELHEFHHAVFEGDDINAELSNDQESNSTLPISQVLYLHTMNVVEEFRHQGLGIALLNALTEGVFLPNNTVIVLKASAFFNELGDPLSAKATGSKKLAAYFRKAGFKNIRRTTSYMYKVIR